MFPPPQNNPPPQRPGGDDNDPGQRPPFQFPRWAWIIVLVVAVGWLLLGLPEISGSLSPTQTLNLPYSEFFAQVQAGNVAEVVLNQDQARGSFRSAVTWPAPNSELSGQIAPRTSSSFVTTLIPTGDPDLAQTLRENGVTIIGQQVQPNLLLQILFSFGPLILLVIFFVWQGRRTQRQMGGVFGFGRTQARQYDAEKPKITFHDVAGQDAAKSELVEIVDFLKDPEKYIALGARIPRGVLLVGPPGTGKTLLARAVAGEANVAFFSIAASEFVEMFVGVGASRVRDLFNRAKASAPAIVFIDEIDAVGRQRGAGLGGGNDEREQTLNQLLAEMDGFDQTESIIIMAATNRPDVLDPALLRPGRFDRQVTVALPDRKGREDILKVHVRGKPLDSDVTLNDLAKSTIGFSGADLMNLANEAALTAARRNARKIAKRDFLEAFDRIVLGTQSPPLSNQEERRVVAYHEAGHALVAALTPGADPVLKVTIVPRGQALGVTAMLPEDDRRNYSKGYLSAQMLVMLGGRVAEEIAIGEITTGASDDLRRVTSMARRMVSQFGMSETIGPVNFGEDERQPFLGYSLSQGRTYSESTAAQIDAEVRRIVEDAHRRTRKVLIENRDKLEELAQDLLTNEVVDAERVLTIAGTLPADKRDIPSVFQPEGTNS